MGVVQRLIYTSDSTPMLVTKKPYRWQFDNTLVFKQKFIQLNFQQCRYFFSDCFHDLQLYVGQDKPILIDCMTSNTGILDLIPVSARF